MLYYKFLASKCPCLLITLTCLTRALLALVVKTFISTKTIRLWETFPEKLGLPRGSSSLERQFGTTINLLIWSEKLSKVKL